MTQYKKILQINPTYPNANFGLGNIYRKQSRYQESKEEYEKALKLNPEHADAHFNLGIAHELLNDGKNAVASVAMAEQLYGKQGRENRRRETASKIIELYEKFGFKPEDFIN